MNILKEREGMLIYYEDVSASVVKVAKDEVNHEALKNSWRFLKALENTPYAPSPYFISADGNQLKMEHIQATPITDIELARRHAVQLLWTLQQHGITHGDLTEPNIIWRDNIPVAIDWDQSNFSHFEARPSKRPKPDSDHMIPAIIATAGDPSRVLRRWQAIKPHISYYFGWGRFLDLGTHYGDFCGLAAIEGLRPHGVDNEQIRPCIEPSRNLWGDMGCTFEKNEIPDIKYNAEIAMLFSTWSYIVQDYGKPKAWQVLEDIISQSEIFLFENQLFGDGPGPSFLKDKDDVVFLLKQAGAGTIEEIITIPVEGRNAERTVWLVRKI